MIINWHARDVNSILKSLNTSLESGLSSSQVTQLQKRYGKNILQQTNRFKIYKSIRNLLLAPLSIVLLLALVATILLGAYTDAVVILIALVINVFIGALQEGKSAKVFESLERSALANATVLRDGAKQVLSSAELVLGDIVYLEGGHKVPADLRLVEVESLYINEAALTGEWLAVEKDSNNSTINNSKERSNMALMGTVVSQGYGHGIVVAIGDDTEFGSLAKSTTAIGNTKTPLSKSINNLAHVIIGIIGVVIAIIFAVGILRGGEIADMLLLSIAIAVAAMPEGLPAAVTVTLTIAMEAILRKGGLVKNLLAAETLGTATVILTDKTGTLTSGIMKLAQVHTNLEAQQVSLVDGDTLEILKMAVLASDAFIDGVDDNNLPKVHGRPLEIAIINGGIQAGLYQDELFKIGNERREFLQFESGRRYAASLNDYHSKSSRESNSRLYVTGSPEHILAHATHYLHDGKRLPLTLEVREQFKEIQDSLSSEGKRFIAVAYRESSEHIIPNDIRSPQDGERLGFVFGGLISFTDPVREDVSEAIATAKRAGVQVIMVTGDHGETAKAVADEVGLNSANIILGSEFASLADEALVLAVNNGNIFARMLPEQKLRLATVLRASGEVVAMTGDGVNDAPALIAANIGIAQGSGTDVAKEASDIVLTTGSFSIIIAAIKEGRRALSNLRKIVAYLLATSASEVVLIGGSMLMGLSLPLLPAQILWANIVGGGFMSFPFAFEPASKGIMSRKPKRGLSNGTILSGGFDKVVLVICVASGAILLILYAILNYLGTEIAELRSIMFAALSIGSIFLAFSFKNMRTPIWHTNILSNKYLLVGLTVAISLLYLSLTWAPLMALLSLTAISAKAAFYLVILGIANVIVVELAKAYFTVQK